MGKVIKCSQVIITIETDEGNVDVSLITNEKPNWLQKGVFISVEGVLTTLKAKAYKFEQVEPPKNELANSDLLEILKEMNPKERKELLSFFGLFVPEAERVTKKGNDLFINTVSGSDLEEMENLVEHAVSELNQTLKFLQVLGADYPININN